MGKIIFVQGAAKPSEEEYQAGVELGRLFKEKGVTAMLGATGQFVAAVIEGGCEAIPIMRGSDKELAFDPSKVEVINCAIIATHAQRSNEVLKFKPIDRNLAWGIGLAYYLSADAYVFFAGAYGTLAHLAPILAFIIKGREKGKKAKKVALVGWDECSLESIKQLFDLKFENEINKGKGELPDFGRWIQTFDICDIDEVAEFVS